MKNKENKKNTTYIGLQLLALVKIWVASKETTQQQGRHSGTVRNELAPVRRPPFASRKDNTGVKGFRLQSFHKENEGSFASSGPL